MSRRSHVPRARGAARSRRRVLKMMASAVPFCVGAGGIGVLQSCTRASDDGLALGAREAVDRIRRGELKAEAYATQLLRHHHAHADLNAIVAMNEERVLESARAVDRARGRGDTLGPAAGLPVAVKDQVEVAGYPATAGNGALKGYIPKETAAVVAKLTDAGAYVFAKTICSDMVGYGALYAEGATSNNSWYGSPRNPYDAARTPGGSSGGNGTLLAARIVPAAIGEDSGGSVRFPAACCGHAALRPSTHTVENLAAGTMRKRWSDHGMIPPAGVVDTFGPMARTVADVAYLDTLVTGDAVAEATLKGVRIGIPRGDYWELDIIDPGVRKVTEEAYAKLRAIGVELIEVDIKAIMALNQGSRLHTGGAPVSFEEWLASHVPGVTMEQVLARRGVPDLPDPLAPPMPEPAPEERLRIFTESLRYYTDVFHSNGLAAISFPTITFPAPLINPNGDTPLQRIRINGKLVEELDAIIYNLFAGPRFGAPGLSFPSGMTGGMPVSLELEGLPGDDSKILGLGLAIEKVLGPIPPPVLKPVDQAGWIDDRRTAPLGG